MKGGLPPSLPPSRDRRPSAGKNGVYKFATVSPFRRRLFTVRLMKRLNLSASSPFHGVYSSCVARLTFANSRHAIPSSRF